MTTAKAIRERDSSIILDEKRGIKTSLSMLITIGTLISGLVTGYIALKAADDTASFKIVELEKTSAAQLQQIVEMQKSLKEDHDLLIRIDANVKIMRERMK